MALQIPSTGGFITIDTSLVSKIVDLPLSSDRIGRIVTIKDRSGNADVNSVTINTQGGDTFQNGSTTYLLREAFGSVSFISRSGQWISFSETIGIQSTIQGLGSIGYISTGGGAFLEFLEGKVLPAVEILESRGR